MYNAHFLENLKIYLDKSGWKVFDTQYKGLILYLNESFPDLRVVIPLNFDIPDSNQRIDDSINLLALIREEKKEVLINLLSQFNVDLHNYRIPGKDISSVPLYLAEEIISSTRKLIYLSAQAEFEKMKDYFKKENKSKMDVSSDYIQQCKFAHTWKGSFGFTIEAPLNLTSIGIFNDQPANYERKISQKIYDGMKIIKHAEKLNADNYIVDNSEIGFNSKMLKEVLEIGEHINYNNLEYSTTWSPALPVETIYTEIKSFLLNKSTFQLVEKAVSKLNVDDDEYEIIFYGFPEGLKSTKELLLDKSLEGKRYIYVRGFSENIKEVTLKLDLNLVDYLKAVHAHENHNDVKVKCVVKKKPKGWEVLKVTSFDVL